ncbi:MAG: enoyl-CoA hydratase/isomerase family protein [Chloroflexi bacterium]|nr:enoyl-CoA hydratase/isomerase family protein [Chloroflexota bacterium]
MIEARSVILVERDGHIAIVTLNRPEAMNALSSQLIGELEATATTLRDDDDIWVVVLRSASDRAFGVGADLKERKGMSLEAVRAQRRQMVRAFNEWAILPKPVIAAVNGFALGGGLELALAADIVVASEDAQLGLPEVGLAIIPGAGGTQRLPRAVGKMKAKEMIFTGDRIDAKEAERIGLVSRVVSREQLDAEALRLARRMAQNGPLALAMAKRAIDLGSETEITVGLAYETEAYDVLLKSEDRDEGLLAFNEKRKPQYKRR